MPRCRTSTSGSIGRNPEIVTIAGESGSGKSTLANLVLGFDRPTSGTIRFDGLDVGKANRKELRNLHRRVQAVFQDPFDSYNPFYRVRHVFDTVIRNFGLASNGASADGMIEEALNSVGLESADVLRKYPHQLSGGQRQRIMFARACLVKPSMIVADEPVSMVDASLRANILDVMIRLRDEAGISFLYITHDLSTAYQVGDRIVLLYQGCIAEEGVAADVISDPRHPYVRLLVDSVPQPDPERRWQGEIKLPAEEDIRIASATGCRFVPRCHARDGALPRRQATSPCRWTGRSPRRLRIVQTRIPMNHEFRFTAEKIRSRIKLVRAHRFIGSVELDPFRLQELPEAVDRGSRREHPDGLPIISPGVHWCGINRRFRLSCRFRVPEGWRNPALFLPLGDIGDLFNHPEALVCIDGEPVGSADRNHHTIALDPPMDGLHSLVLEGWTGWSEYPPAHDSPKQLQMQQCCVVETAPLLDEFLTRSECALESALLLEAGAPERNAILDALDHAFLVLDTRHPPGEAMHASASDALEALEGGLERAGQPLDVTLLGIGHAHMDVGYLWTVSETRRKSARTFANVLRLMDRYPGYHFTHSQPALYAMTRDDCPAVFSRIARRVDEGRWEVTGGMWVEPDTNMPGAESLVRQLLLGRRWFSDAFGDAETPILWLPDSFGFSWCIPQLMKLSGLKMMVTNKPNWNQHNRLPFSTFSWEGMDGTRVPVHVLTTPRPVEHLPFPTNYKSDLSGTEVKGTLTNAKATELRPLPICFGFGDGGGGPTEELIRRAHAFGNMPAMPRIRMGRASELLDAVNSLATGLPVLKDEIYCEGHRGVLTGQGWIKRANRQAEASLHRAELLCVLSGKTMMPARLNSAWELLCLNQFHDILTGTCIPQVMQQARLDFGQIFDTCNEIAADALADLEPGPVGVLNPSPLPRHDLATLDGQVPSGICSQQTETGTLVGLPVLPAYGCAELSSAGIPEPLSIERNGQCITLRNSRIIARIDGDGRLGRMFDIQAEREILADGQCGNQIWAFEDRPIAWDAWDIDPFFEDRAEEVTNIRSIRITESGPLRVEVTVDRQYRDSLITQKIRMTDRSPRIDFATLIDWNESHVLLKAAFPVAVSSSSSTSGIQWGQIDRPTTRANSRDASRFEVCAQKWMAIHDGTYAVAVLDDCKYGHDAHVNILRVTLLKSSTSPDPNADRGRHEFTYSIVGQEGPGFLGIRAEAEALNHPVVMAPGLGMLPTLVESNKANVLIETVKPSEDGIGYIIRVYEADGRSTRASLTLAHDIAAAEAVNLLEVEPEALASDGNSLEIALAPRQIMTIRIVPAK